MIDRGHIEGIGELPTTKRNRVSRDELTHKTNDGAEINSFCCHESHLHLVVFTRFLVEHLILYSSISLRFNDKKCQE